MEMTPRMEQSMRLLIAPKMIQSMEILQLPVMALVEKIQAELEENPVLEESRDPKVADDEDMTETPPPAAEAEFNPDAPLKHDNSDTEFNRLDELNKDWDEYFDADHRPSRAGAEELSDRKQDAMQNVAEAPRTLHDHLTEQLAYLDLTPEMYELCAYVISHLDENGYLVAHDPDKKEPREIAVDELVRTFPGEVTLADVEEAIGTVQTLDPPGVGARTVKECLALQVGDETPHRELVRQLVEHHLDDVAHNRLPVIQKKTGATIEAIQEAIQVLRGLDPRPGARFAADAARYVVPDVVVERTDDGGFDIRLTDDRVPNVRISKRYVEFARDRGNDPKAREFLKRKLTSANWLLEAIEQRRNTLTRVTRAIIDFQRDFLDKGPDYIRPLKMEEVADVVKVHVTTVSRAVDDKWVQTPRGVFPLKRFFGGGTRNEITGEAVAWETIKQKLLEIIAQEDKSKPLSDDEIVEKLSEAGLKVARRTVTKYREALDIPSSRQRKDWTKT
jgi:RNA polymerase sigma-54 factor